MIPRSPTTRGGAVGNHQWMTTAIAVAAMNPLRKLRKPSLEER